MRSLYVLLLVFIGSLLLLGVASTNNGDENTTLPGPVIQTSSTVSLDLIGATDLGGPGPSAGGLAEGNSGGMSGGSSVRVAQYN
jgi:hypothetical protein